MGAHFGHAAQAGTGPSVSEPRSIRGRPTPPLGAIPKGDGRVVDTDPSIAVRALARRPRNRLALPPLLKPSTA